MQLLLLLEYFLILSSGCLVNHVQSTDPDTSSSDKSNDEPRPLVNVRGAVDVTTKKKATASTKKLHLPRSVTKKLHSPLPLPSPTTTAALASTTESSTSSRALQATTPRPTSRPTAAATSPVVVRNNFCWLDSTTRGAGTIPDTCPSGQELIGALCYSRCPTGYTRFGFDCHQNCQFPFTDTGLFCQLLAYGRGGGFPWVSGDRYDLFGCIDSAGFCLGQAQQRCETNNPATGCERCGAIYYPRCRAGYSPSGCNLCAPASPSCNALGYNPGAGLLCGNLCCAKKIIIGDAKPMTCKSGLQLDAGLCYPTCAAGGTGVGPVCWSKPPTGWVQCGLGAARTDLLCASQVFSQVAAVGQLAFTIGTLGSGAGAGQIAMPGRFDDLIKAFNLIKNNPGVMAAFEIGSATIDAVRLYMYLTGDLTPDTPEEAVRLAAQAASFFDTSGISSTIAAFTYPKCSKLVL